MDLELPERLQATRDLLIRSMVKHSRDPAPPIPPGLAEDLAARFAPREAESDVSPRTSWVEKIRTLLATPAFGAAAAAVLLVGIMVPMLSLPDSAETFRGGGSPADQAGTVRIVFVGENPVLRAEIERSGDFEASAFTASGDGPRVIVDFNNATVSAVDAAGASVHQTAIPADPSQLPAQVAEALSYLGSDE